VTGRGASRPSRTISRAFVVSVSLGSFGALLLPWVREGSTERNAFALGKALNETGLITTSFERGLYDALIVVPVLVGIVGAATLLRRDGMAALLASTVGGIELFASVAVIAKVHKSVEVGPWLSIVVGGITAASWPLWQMTRERVRVR
jgi:hypothetical protein